MKHKTGTFLSWLDDNILLLLSAILLIFIPIYPKIPLAEIIPGYIVRVRLEDVFVFISALVWLIQVLRKKIKYQSVVFWLICIYLFVSLLSVISAATITHTIPWQLLHVGKSFLHWVRYFEYFVLFVIIFSSVKTLKDVKFLLSVMFITLLAVIVYGYGQKFYYWPVFSTMNREFSKGIRLYLTEHARVQSTFGGHYDLAGYLVILLNLALALAISVKEKLKKLVLHLLHLAGLWLLILSASRISFAAYYVGIIATIGILSFGKYRENQTHDHKSKNKIKLKSFLWWINQSFKYSFLVLIMMLAFGQDMSDRLFHVLKDYPQIEKSYQQAELFVEKIPENVMIFLGINQVDRQPSEDWVAVNIGDQVEEIDPVLNKTDQRPVSDKPRPDDVYVDIPDKVRIATESATGEKSFITVERDRTWSDNALNYGLSVAIRLDTLWPNAIKGFRRNPILGSGFATLNKESFYHFTEAESTDNNFLRTLGETGLLGFITFYSIIVVSITLAFKLFNSQIVEKQANLRANKALLIGLSAGYIGATIGILVNALYIDVYASSKVAFTYWSLTGLILALCYHSDYWQYVKNSWPIEVHTRAKNKLHKLLKKKQ
ncbi:MAG: Uncharacterized protein XD95_0627 [Microgenomates bacterium 39_7]|nr:MAG: Uncharacterized protein XD95_0627 [Microgenomates bacterium 39_7]